MLLAILGFSAGSQAGERSTTMEKMKGEAHAITEETKGQAQVI
jgi:hypothetical protein